MMLFRFMVAAGRYRIEPASTPRQAPSPFDKLRMRVVEASGANPVAVAV